MTMPAAPRSLAIDVMRGMTLALMVVVNMSIDDSSYGWLLHAAWHGLTLTDLVFPSFLFLVGASLSHTLAGYARAGEPALLRRILTRTVALFLLGVALNWFPFVYADPAGHWSAIAPGHVRILGVLQRISLAYGSAALIVHYGGRAAAVSCLVLGLLGYWWILGAFGDYSLPGNAVLKLDALLLGRAHLYHGEAIAFDPEGLLSTLPAVANVLAGYLAGHYLREAGAGYEAIAKLLLCACGCVAVALAWNGVLPINKKLWTSSYALCTIGIDLATLATLVYWVDLRGLRGWTRPFTVLGRNTLFVFLLSELGERLLYRVRVGQDSLFDVLYEQGFQPWSGDAPGALLYALCYLGLCWLAAWEMHRRRIYLRL